MALRRQLFLLALLPAVAVAFMGKCVLPAGHRPTPSGPYGRPHIRLH